jgi:hypothetical protein
LPEWADTALDGFRHPEKRLNMNNDMIGGVIRAIVPASIAYLVGKGSLPVGDYSAVVTGLVALVTAIWSVRSNTTGKTIK